MTVIEALCLGRPIIANKVGAIEYMLSPENSYTIDIRNLKDNPEQMVEQWSKTIEEAIEEKDINESRRFYAWKNRHQQREKYSVENWVNKTMQIYQEI